MARSAWRTIIASRYFYVRTYRRLLFMIMVSLSMSALLGISIAYVYFNRPPRTFYATNGITSPMQLNALEGPNQTANFLLAEEPPSIEAAKVIPK